MKDINDTERFYDPCDDTRTKSQIIWEEGIYKEGSFRQKWAYNFGKNGFYKFGKKIAAFFTVMLFWVVLESLIPYNIMKIIFQILGVVAVNLGSIWLYRQTCEDKNIAGLNIAYIICCGIFTAVFYKYMNFVFGYMSLGIFLSLYYVIYVTGGNMAFVLRIVISAVLIYNSIRYNLTKSKEDILGVVISVTSIMTGILCKVFGGGNILISNLGLIAVMVSVIIGFLLYMRTGNKFLRNITILFAIISLMEILGSNAAATGAMENYIKNGNLKI